MPPLSPPPKGERKLLALCRKGDESAWASVYATYKPMVLGIVRRFILPNEVEDVVQIVFLQLYRKLHLFKWRSQFRTWLYRLTVNCCLMYLRDYRNRFRIDLVSLDSDIEMHNEDGDHFSAQQTSDNFDPDAPLKKIDLAKAIAKLPPGYKLHLELHDIEGYWHTEISQIVGCTDGNSKSQLHKGRKQLRSQLSGYAAGRGRKKRTRWSSKHERTDA